MAANGYLPITLYWQFGEPVALAIPAWNNVQLIERYMLALSASRKDIVETESLSGEETIEVLSHYRNGNDV